MLYYSLPQANADVKKAARVAGVPQWMICERLSISEPTLTRWLRVELPADKRQRILDAIAELSGEQDDIGEG